MLKPEEVGNGQNGKRRKIFVSGLFLRFMQMMKHWTGNFSSCIMNYSLDMTAVNAEIAVNCIMVLCRKKIWQALQSTSVLPKSS